MELIAVVFKSLYTSLLLRDVIGKIVPGTILIGSIFSLFMPLNNVSSFLSKKLFIQTLVLIGGTAWILVLGTQWAAEAIGIWNYYPRLDGSGNFLAEMTAQGVMERFKQIACPSERDQYERYVVIKEATGNLLTCLIISAPLIITSLMIFNTDDLSLKDAARPHEIFVPVKFFRIILIISLFIGTCVSLRQMNIKHVEKQYAFAEATLKFKATKDCSTDSSSSSAR